jgi:glycosyltransferase involved in cell wall biosynthesis
MIQQPLIIIVLPNYNGIKYLARVMDSFLAQNHTDKRLIVVDGKSSDGSHALLEQYSALHSEIVWLNQPDRGISSALNIALHEVPEHAVWGYLGADDILMPGVLGDVAQVFDIEPSLTGVYYDSYGFQPGGSMVYRRCPNLPFNVSSLLKHGTLVGLQNIYIRAHAVKTLQFNETARYAMDYDLYLRALVTGFASFMHRPLPSTINIADGNLSTVYQRQANLEALACAQAAVGWNHALVWRYVKHYAGALLGLLKGGKGA